MSWHNITSPACAAYMTVSHHGSVCQAAGSGFSSPSRHQPPPDRRRPAGTKKTPGKPRKVMTWGGRSPAQSAALRDGNEFTGRDKRPARACLEVYNGRLMAFPDLGLSDLNPSTPMPGARRRFHAMVKPIGAACNLDCKYCYYLSKGDLLDQQPGSRIADDLLEEFIRQYIAGQDGERVVFSWQGGEPTLLGLDFFRKVVALEAKHKRPGQRIENDLQTNGTLLDETWCRFLREQGFLVGLSIDGPRNLHDAYRVTKGGQPTFDKVFAAAKLLRRRGREIQHASPWSTASMPRGRWTFIAS